ncbi:MAG: YncE family protein [Rhodothermales bacterium]
MRQLSSLLLLLLLVAMAGVARGQAYYVYVTAESDDEVDVVRFDAEAEEADVVERIRVGVLPTENEGPHGIAVAPDGKHWFLSMAHGIPYGKLYKYTTGTNEKVGEVELGFFPATISFSEATGLLYVVNFNLHGDHEPSTVSVVEPETMTEVTQIETGVMPHGSRIAPGGRRHYSVAMMSGELFEIDTQAMAVKRRLATGIDGTSGSGTSEAHGHHTSAMAERTEPSDSAASDVISAPMPKPTWVQPHPTKPLVYVANNGTDEVVEVDTEKWEVTRRFATGAGPYNLDVSPDGTRLVVSYKGAGATGVWDLEAGKELATIPNSRKVTHGVAISPDGRYAFLSVEGIGGEPGAVDVIDLQKLALVATAETGKQAGGIAFWKVDAETP